MCLTAHWIDNDWNLYKRILNFCLVPNHKGETIGKTVESCLLDWGIDQIFTITVDNASSNDGAIKYLKRRTKDWKGTVLGHDFMHLRCCAHIVNLIVKEGLEEHHESIIKIRNAVRYVRSSPARSQSFKRCVEKEKIESKNLVSLDVETRWNSTYMMLEAAEKFEKAFDRLGEEDQAYLSYFDCREVESEGIGCASGNKGGTEIETGSTETTSGVKKGKGKGNKSNIGPPKEEDWKNARCLVKFLKLFYSVTLRFSGSLYVTSNSFFHELVSVQTRLVQLTRGGDDILSSMAYRMKKKFDKYWKNLNNLNFLLYVAIVLDPRYKLKYVRFIFNQIYSSLTAGLMIERVEATLIQLHDYYLNCESNVITDLASCNSSMPSKEMDIDENEEDAYKLMEYQFARHLEEEENMEGKLEVNRYLLENCEKIVDSFNILGWWKQNAKRYPIMSQVAKDVLAMPVSTVASESAFSTGGRILDPFRSSLSPKMVEALICAQNWLRSKQVPINLREKMDQVERYEEIESEFLESSSTFEESGT